MRLPITHFVFSILMLSSLILTSSCRTNSEKKSEASAIGTHSDQASFVETKGAGRVVSLEENLLDGFIKIFDDNPCVSLGVDKDTVVLHRCKKHETNRVIKDEALVLLKKKTVLGEGSFLYNGVTVGTYRESYLSFDINDLCTGEYDKVCNLDRINSKVSLCIKGSSNKNGPECAKTE